MKRFLIVCGTTLLVFAVPALNATPLYTHNFADLHDIVTDGGPTLTPNVAAPGGKGGIALQFDNGTSSYAILQPTGVVIPSDSTTTFRIFITSKTNFMGMYDYSPGEGLRFVDGGGLQHSNGGGLPATWAFNNWYTVGLHVSGSGAIDIYFKPGANAQLTAGDLQGGTAGGAGAMNRTAFFNYGGQYFLADYTVNQGLDLSTVPEPASALLLGLGALILRRRR